MTKKELQHELDETRRSHLDTANLMDFYRSCVFDLAAKLIRIENAVTDGERHGPGIHFRGSFNFLNDERENIYTDKDGVSLTSSSCTTSTREIGGRSDKGRPLPKKKGE
jgi:hypothetical protein